MLDAAVNAGLPADIATELVVEVLAGSAALLRARGSDTLAVRREVTSPGGSTARGLAALERAGIRAAFDDALEAVSRDERVLLAAAPVDIADYVERAAARLHAS